MSPVILLLSVVGVVLLAGGVSALLTLRRVIGQGPARDSPWAPPFRPVGSLICLIRGHTDWLYRESGYPQCRRCGWWLHGLPPVGK